MAVRAIVTMRTWKIWMTLRHQIEAVGSVVSLFRLSYKHARVLRNYQKQCTRKHDQRRDKFFILLPLLLPPSEYARLFRLSEMNIIESRNSEKLNKIYREIVSMKPSNPLAVPPLSSHTAIAMQRTFVTHVFREILGLKLEPYEANVLQHFSGVSLALIRFLEFCGCPGNKTDPMPLDIELKSFIIHAEEQLYKSGELHKLIEDYKKLRSLIGPMRSIWLRIRDLFLRRRWHQKDKNEYDSLIKKEQSRYYELLDELTNDAILKFNEIQRRGVEIILAFKIHLRAIKILTKIASNQQNTSDGFLFRDILESLKTNLNLTN